MAKKTKVSAKRFPKGKEKYRQIFIFFLLIFTGAHLFLSLIFYLLPDLFLAEQQIFLLNYLRYTIVCEWIIAFLIYFFFFKRNEKMPILQPDSFVLMVLFLGLCFSYFNSTLISNIEWFLVLNLLMNFFFFEKWWLKKIFSRWTDSFEKGLPKVVSKLDGNYNKQHVAVEKMKIGEIFYAESGDIIPLDSYVVRGAGIVQENIFYSIKRQEKNEKDLILSGAKIIEGSFNLMVKAPMEQVSLQQIKAFFHRYIKTTQNTSDYFLTYFFIVNLLIAFLIFVGAFFFHIPFLKAFQWVGLLLFTAAISPFNMWKNLLLLQSIQRAFEQGILLGNRQKITIIPNIQSWFFEKSGILTKKKFIVNEIQTFNVSLDEVGQVMRFLFRHYVAKKTSYNMSSVLQELSVYFSGTPEKNMFFTEIHYSLQGFSIKEKLGNTYEFSNIFPKINLSKEPLKENIQMYIAENESMSEEAIEEWENLTDPEQAEEHLGFDYYLIKNKQIIAQFLMQEKEREGAAEIIEYLTKKNKETILLTQENNKKDEKWKEIFSLVYQKIKNKIAIEWIKERQKKHEIALFTNHIEKYPIDKDKTVFFSFCEPHQVMWQNTDIVFLSPNFSSLIDVLKIIQQAKRKIHFSQYLILSLFFINIYTTIMANFSILPSLFFISTSYFSVWALRFILSKK
jgi:cation transport ATPase